MKLINKISYRLFVNSFIVLILLAFFSFFLMNYILEAEINEQLLSTKDRIIKNGLSSKQIELSPLISVEKINTGIIANDVYKDTLIYNSTEKEDEEFRELISYCKTNIGIYKITVRSSLIEKEDLLLTTLFTFLIVYLLFVLSLYVINKRSAKEILTPFYNTLDRISLFKLSGGDKFKGERTNIEEFNSLNNIFESLTEKIIKEYTQVKEFTDNASHEIQTPLAVIKSKLDMLIQTEDLSEEQKDLIKIIFSNLNKLSRLNKSLLLLAKIEGDQFSDSKDIELRKILENEVEEYAELAELKGLTFKAELISNPILKANEMLILVLIKNVLTNSIKHNIEKGWIKLSLSEDSLTVENTGTEPNDNPERLFERFYKNNDSTDSVGLGLSIVKQICLLYKFRTKYLYKEGVHSVTIYF